MKGQDKNPRKTTKWSRDKQPSRKRIQNIDSEDNPGSQEKNGGKDWEDAKNFCRRTKEQTEMNNALEGISSRITEAEEWINDLQGRILEITATEENIEKGKKKKLRQPKRPLGKH